MANTLNRIGVVNMAVPWWTAGATYTRMLVQSLATALAEDARNDIELWLLSKKKIGDEENELPAKARHFKQPTYFIGERIARNILRLPLKSELYETATCYKMSVLLPVIEIPTGTPSVPTVGWIPDFQWRHWPEFYSAASVRSRDMVFRALAESSQFVMLSSESARADYEAFAPDLAAKARVLPFPSLFAFQHPGRDIADVCLKFNLPEKFTLVANQFWQHKNHITVVHAIARLAAHGLRVPVVMTGQPSDVRDAQNKTLSRLLQAIASTGLAAQIVVLGHVDYSDLVALMRAAAIVIQPSQSEGWSTVVQDAKALGRPLICSDIAVHREQAPAALGFFEWNREDQLARVIAQHWRDLQPGPDATAERMALEIEKRFAAEHGHRLLALCREAVELR